MGSIFEKNVENMIFVKIISFVPCRNQGWGWEMQLLRSSPESARTKMTLTEFKPTFRSILELFLEVSGQFSRKWGWWLHSITMEVGPIFPLKGPGAGKLHFSGRFEKVRGRK